LQIDGRFQKRRLNMVRGWQSTLLGLTTAALLGIGIARADEPIKIGFAIAQSMTRRASRLRS